MTNIEKLVALYRKMSRIEKDYDGQSFDYAVGMKLGAMAKDGGADIIRPKSRSVSRLVREYV